MLSWLKEGLGVIVRSVKVCQGLFATVGRLIKLFEITDVYKNLNGYLNRLIWEYHLLQLSQHLALNDSLNAQNVQNILQEN